jgi:large subunit ribosomal protein L7Ae
MSFFYKRNDIQRNNFGDNGNSLLHFESKSKIFKIGRDIQPKRDLSRFIKWPLYIQIQRERKILCERLKIPPIINQFSRSLDKNITKQLFHILSKYKTDFSDDGFNKIENKICLKHGINTVTNLIQKKKALFVLIANDVNPIELVVWLPALCLKMNIPYCIIKDKSKLGKLINRKATSCITVTSVLEAEKEKLEKIIDCFRLNFNDRYEEGKKRWGDKSFSNKKNI